ncbi:lipopolysaccharide kinase InaA family protein [Yinghuangia soli]|uniref:Protein kinase domain-containing protein n=1 Tax=Yinghuangia soli TaxID=2908204 RepID=A0AA41TYR9_9ACTN|nr:lipopolysaccharide kinase InaA family protein [Yinghuangia soli]MCF2526711.1 hypothetical protein [Yinghuangia soli]
MDLLDQLHAQFGRVGSAVPVSDRGGTQVWRVDTAGGVVAVKLDTDGGRAAAELAVLRMLAWPALAGWGESEGRAWLATRWVAGQTTTDVWSAVRQSTSHHPQVRRRTLLATLDLCEAVARLHRAGWLHGDLRPEHCLHARGGVRLIGLSHAVGPAADTPYRSSGEPGADGAEDLDLVAPELCAAALRGEPARPSPASEVYALAAMIRKCWTGASPLDYDGAEPAAERRRRLIADGLPLRAVPDRCAWPALDARLATALRHDPDARPRVAQLARMIGSL